MNRDFENIYNIETNKPVKNEKYEALKRGGKPKDSCHFLKIPTHLIPGFLNSCKIGDGPSYENYVFAALSKILGSIIPPSIFDNAANT